MSSRFKYPRTPHLEWSPGATSDDIRLSKPTVFKGKEIVVTEKMDGENTTFYNDFMHARSIDSRYHSSRDWVKQLHANIAHDIPVGWRVCGENLYARHALGYDNLESYFYGFSLWDGNNNCLSWSDTIDWFGILNLSSAPVIYQGNWDEEIIRDIEIDTDKTEGYVVRLQDSFHYDDFTRSVAKWVRPNHVQTDKHWMHTQIVENKLKSRS